MTEYEEYAERHKVFALSMRRMLLWFSLAVVSSLAAAYLLGHRSNTILQVCAVVCVLWCVAVFAMAAACHIRVFGFSLP